MTYSTIGYIIGKNDSREYDRTFILYTKEHGKMTVFAQGVRKISSKLCGNLEPISKVSLIVARGRSLDRITGVEMLDRFLPIKEQLGKMSAAYFFLEVFNHLVKDGQRDDKLYELIGDFFTALYAVQVSKAGLVGSAALIRLSGVLGYQGRSKGVIQSLQRSQSLLAFVRGRKSQDYQTLLHCTRDFIENQCELIPRSTAYFEHYANGS